ncbi:ATP-binding cassette domain-containing protein [Cupriavidus sp. D39]|nr:ATP-binding cassette domain-containing protein [Cupriavidus sp. D39]
MSAALELNDVRKKFGQTEIIRGVNLTIPKGERHALIGPNGAGKSTTFNLISGRFAPSSGTVKLNGQQIGGLQPFVINRMGLSRSFQITNIFHRLSVFENLRCAVLWSLGYKYSFWHRLSELRDARERADEVLELIGLQHRRNTQASLLTYAEQRALEIGITIAGGAEVILLDEPTAGMSRSESDHAVELDPSRHRGQDPGDGGARYERGVRAGRPYLGAGLRRGHRHRHARSHPRQPQGQGSLPGHDPGRSCY